MRRPDAHIPLFFSPPQELSGRVASLAAATAATRANGAPFRNMLFYGPPGTGKARY